VGNAAEQGHHADDHKWRWTLRRSGSVPQPSLQNVAPSMPPITWDIPGPKMPPEQPDPIDNEVLTILAKGSTIYSGRPASS
jgi:hypothetical protein